MNDDFFNKVNNMKVAKNTVVSIAYQVRTQDGVLVDEAPANQPLEYLQGHNNLIIGLENALEGKEVGDKFEVRVQPEEGYGEYNENMVQRVPKDVFQGVDEVVVGMRFLADTDIGPVPVVITEVDGDEVVVDGNHMLAGQELHFTVEVVGTREATLEEIAHGHVHGAHDHHHHHHADEVFTSWGKETPKKYNKEELDTILQKLSKDDSYGMILRSKGILQTEDGSWVQFDLVPGEYEIREGSADYTGRICVIGSKLKEDELEGLFF